MQKLVHYDEKSGKIVKIYDKDAYCKMDIANKKRCTI